MNAHPQNNSLLAPLHRLDQRVRWKRWLGKTNRFVWLMAVLFLGMFLADTAIGFRTFTLRACFAGFALTASVLLILDGLTCWLARLDLLGLAQIIENRYPALAERLLTMVQMETDSTVQAHPELAASLRNETVQQLETVDPQAACPLNREKRAWLMTLPVLGLAMLGLCFAPAFREFSDRFFASWLTPLTPYHIKIDQLRGYALRGSAYEITGTIERVDPYAPDVAECRLSKEDESATEVATTAIRAGRFSFRLEKLANAWHCRVSAGDTRSDLIEIEVIDAPILTAPSKLTVVPPTYLAKQNPGTFEVSAHGPPEAILQYSRMLFAFTLDQSCRGTLVLESTSAEKGAAAIRVPLRPGGANRLVAEMAAGQAGLIRAELRLDLTHDLSASIPLGSWHVYADRPPRFTQPLRFIGASANLQSSKPYRIAPDDVMRLEAAVADEEGLSAVDVEFCVNDQPPKLVPWINGAGKRQMTINERLPLPTGLKQGDRVQFRLRARDNRELRRGESEAAPPLPPADLGPQMTFAPEGSAPNGWIQLDIDQSIDSFLKTQAAAQGEEIRSAIDAVKNKIREEAAQVEKLKRGIHLQAALTLDQRLQTEKLQALNREIVEDLSRAGQRFLLNPELARLAEHFLDIAETEMEQAGGALARFGAKDRALTEGEKDLQAAHDALLRALKKLDRMNDWNKLLAQDRLDQAQLDKLAQRQQDLADRLEALRKQEGLSDADLAKQIEAIRQEQVRIAEKTEQLKDDNQLVRESLAALDRQRVAKLAQDAQQLAAEQQALRDLAPAKMPPELKQRLQELVKRQTDLGNRIPGKPALEAADLLKKPSLDRAIERQKEQEKQLQSARTNLLPGGVVNALRTEIVRLAKEQSAIRADLERVGQRIGQFNETMLKERLKELVARQRDLRSAIAKLPVDTAERAGQQLAEQLACQAADYLTAKDALRSYDTMENAQRELEKLASVLPPRLARDRQDIKDPMVLAKLEQVEQFADRQKELRKETEQLLADWLKAAAGKEGSAVRDKMERLAKELLELTQKGASPEAKALAKQSSAALDRAKKAMDAGSAAKGKGESSKTQDEEAAKQLASAAKQLQSFAQDQAKKAMSKTGPTKTAEALKAGAEQMKLAQAKLPGMTKDAQAAMQAAADQLAQAANQASKQTSKNLPKAGRKPAAKAGPTPASTNVPLPGGLKLEPFQGKSWGELPGELKTRMIQDFRTRYGDEYAEVIQQYFERLATVPTVQKK